MIENNLPVNIDLLTDRENHLKTQVFQRATLEYREALRLEEAEGGYLQGFKLETPEPTVAFRMDSKDKVIAEDSAVGLEKTLKSHSLLIFIPENSDPERWVDSFWIKHINPKGIEAMYEINKERVGLYEHVDPDDQQRIDMIYQDSLAEEQIVDIDKLAIQAIRQKQLVIKGLNALITSLRTDYIHVPFRS